MNIHVTINKSTGLADLTVDGVSASNVNAPSVYRAMTDNDLRHMFIVTDEKTKQEQLAL